MRKRLLAMALAVACALWVASAGATPPILLEQDRGVYSEALAAEASDFERQVDADEAQDFSDFSASVASAGETAAANASTTADLVSSFAGDVTSATGRAVASSSLTSADALARAPADAFYELVFQAAASEPFFLGATLSVGATGARGDAHAGIELFDLDADAVLVSREAAPGEAVNLGHEGSVQAGTRYRVTAYALAHAPVDGAVESASGDASFQVLVGLPEPAPNLALAASLAALGGLHLLRRRRQAGAAR